MLTAQQLRGVWTALITPFRGGRVDFACAERLVERACEAGLTGVVPLGTTGESPAIGEFEREPLIAKAVAASRGRLRVMVGTGSNNTDKTIHWTQQAADLGADAVLMVAPYYNKPTREGLKRHFLTAADKAAVPIVLYHIPGRCGVGIPADLVLELAKHPRIIGVKEAGGDVWRSGELARQAPKEFAVLSGDDNLTLPLLSVGAVGAVAVISNIAPRLTKSLVDRALSGDSCGAMQIHQRLSPLLAALSLETNPGPIKEAMNLAGIKVGKVRPPLAPVTAATRKALRQALKAVGGLE